ncbi:hypothetical protein KGM_204439 [Danaus plexippus plexippus]|uniref:Uncharacterized protein n=1 Tax=Danaus plexippus plexippus TaxID=278856 RepID=A0A212EXZ5_DANPL|nr:hypothetical protein KGM_204439 [Danaus plexippus plexippus]
MKAEPQAIAAARREPVCISPRYAYTVALEADTLNGHPVKNLKTSSIQTLVENEEAIEKTAEATIAGNITARLPQRSPR